MAFYMRGNAECRVPSYHVCVDTETIPCPHPDRPTEHHHRLMLGCAQSWRYRAGRRGTSVACDFRTRAEWWEWLESRLVKGTRSWVWAHNAAFDFTTLGLWERIDSGQLALKSPPIREVANRLGVKELVAAGPSLITSPFCFLADCVTASGKSVRFIDSTNFAPLKLADLASMLDSEKLPTPGESGADEDWLAYCRRDCDILAALVDRLCGFVRGYDLGNMQLSLGGQAMSHYRHAHLDEDILTGPEETIRPLEREAYYGARSTAFFRGSIVEEGTEAFRFRGDGPGRAGAIASGPVYRLDVNSCYPEVMRVNRYPTRLFRRLHRPAVPELASLLKNHPAVAEVRINSHTEPYPCRRDRRTSWHVGRFWTTLCGPELERAIASNHVESVGEVQAYHSAMLFSSWGEQVAAWRVDADLRGDALSAALLKRMANSLHGKFGQSGRSWDTVPNAVPLLPWGEYSEVDTATGRVTQCRGVGGVKQVYRQEDDAAGACPVIAAFVTGYARELMRTMRIRAGERNVYYEDADSLHVSEQGYQNLSHHGWVHPTTPGRLKLEERADSAEYLGPKHYRFGDRWVIPGHAKNGAYDAKGLWNQTEWVRLDSLLSSGRPTAPITIERGVGAIGSPQGEAYAEDGWIVYRRGG